MYIHTYAKAHLIVQLSSNRCSLNRTIPPNRCSNWNLPFLFSLSQHSPSSTFVTCAVAVHQQSCTVSLSFNTHRHRLACEPSHCCYSNIYVHIYWNIYTHMYIYITIYVYIHISRLTNCLLTVAVICMYILLLQWLVCMYILQWYACRYILQ